MITVAFLIFSIFSTNNVWADNQIIVDSYDPNLFTLEVAFQEKPIIVIIPSYNNAQWCQKNLESVLMQTYGNYKIIYIDDASTDDTVERVKDSVNKYQAWHRFELICNKKRVGALANYYHAIHACPTSPIIVTLDGDDCLAHDGVLAYINEVYQDPEVWITWGQFVEYPSGQKGFAADFAPEVVVNNSYRQHGMPVSHLRTFYAWLFKLIRKEDLMYEGDFYQMTWDKAMMAPMIEMAGGRYKFIDDVLYIYNFTNPISDCRVNGQLQVALRDEIYSKEPYKPLAPVLVKTNKQFGGR